MAVPLIITLTYIGSFLVNVRFAAQTPVSLCTDFTPSDPFPAPIFSFRGQGQLPVYEGPLAKRSPCSEVVSLLPGQWIERTYDLSSLYSFTEGTFPVKYSAPITFVGENGKESVHVSSNVVFVQATKPSLVKNDDDPQQVCEGQQKDDVDQAHNLAKDGCGSSAEKVGDTDLYKRFFGVFDQSRADAVKSNYQSTQSGLGSSAEFSCGGARCTSSTYAYVYPSKPRKLIYLCPQFFNSPMGGGTGTRDTKAGTIVHEGSHLYAGTLDFVYGVEGCEQLAKDNPSYAIKNADSHQYFYEEP